MNSQYLFIIVGQFKGSYFLAENSWNNILGRSWVMSQLGSRPLVIEGGWLLPRKAPFETAGSVNTGGCWLHLGFPFPFQRMTWGQLLCVLCQDLKPGLDGLHRMWALSFAQTVSGYEILCTGNVGQENLRKRLRQPLVQGCRAWSPGSQAIHSCSGTSLYWDPPEVET